MAKRRDGDDQRLFDLPLTPDDRAQENEDRERPPAAGPGRPASGERGSESGLPLFPDGGENAESTPPDRGAPDLEPPELPDPEPRQAGSPEPAPPAQPAPPQPAPFTSRLAAALLDGGVLLAATALALLGAHLLGVAWQSDDLPALGLFLAVFSFVYSVVPLAFWGRTPGMALARVIARGADGGPLTFGQTALRWLGGVLTLALAGLPFLLALAGRSPADWVSGSRTWLHPARAPR